MLQVLEYIGIGATVTGGVVLGLGLLHVAAEKTWPKTVRDWQWAGAVAFVSLVAVAGLAIVGFVTRLIIDVAGRG